MNEAAKGASMMRFAAHQIEKSFPHAFFKFVMQKQVP
jgi:hypothetical protein